MKLIINGRFLTQSASGVQNYAAGIVKALLKTNLEIEIVTPPVPLINASFPSKPIGKGNGARWEQVYLPLYLRKQKDYLLINLCNAAPLAVKNQIVTIHDLAFAKNNKNWFRPAFRNWYRFLIPRICKSSRLIFTVSQFSKQEIIKNYKIAEEKIKIIPNGLPDITFGHAPAVQGNYLLITGADNPRKNVDFVINNIELLKPQGYKLVVLGSSETVFNNVNIPNLNDIIYLENVEQPEYYSLLKNAKALLFPSHYEGFGIPILESLCIGTPVIANNLDVFKESFKNLPIYFNADDAKSFAAALNKLKDAEIPSKEIDYLKNKFTFENSVSLLLKEIEAVKNESSNRSRLV